LCDTTAAVASSVLQSLPAGAIAIDVAEVEQPWHGSEGLAAAGAGVVELVGGDEADAEAVMLGGVTALLAAAALPVTLALVGQAPGRGGALLASSL
jgi:hypothetical protein